MANQDFDAEVDALYDRVAALIMEERRQVLASYPNRDVSKRVEQILDASSAKTISFGDLKSHLNARAGGLPETFAKYRREELLGRGGMGEVYRCTDLRLDREVAAKLLPGVYPASDERVLRFEREARAIAKLNHPYIATVYSLESLPDGRSVLIMEYIQGQSLRERLLDGPLDPEAAILTCQRIAEALASAHDAGIAHRDLKPGNVMLTEQGIPKILDFGLAARLRSDETSEHPSADFTQEGRVIGTPGYMSPEQACGRKLDHRTDIFAFGCVLYECLTGKPAFTGNSPNERIAATLTVEPDCDLWQAPPTIRSVLEACLRKDVDLRPKTMDDVASQLRVVEQDHQPTPTQRISAPRHNLPGMVSRFVGRKRELAHLRELLSNVLLLTLTGPGGGGKTHLALELAERQLHEYPDGVWFVDFSTLRDPSLVPHTLLQILSPDDAKSPSPVAAVVSACKDMHALLVFDNCEHVRDAVANIANMLLKSSKNLKILATGRQPLDVLGEQRFAVPPMQLPEEGASSFDAARTSEAVSLFVDRAALARSNFELTPQNAEAAIAICRAVDGIPLAIELAAACLKSIGLADLRTRLERNLKILETGRRKLQSVIDWSYDELSPDAKALFCDLAVFRGGWTLDAANFVCAQSDGDGADVGLTLGELVDHSLAVMNDKEDGSTRYTFLQPIREYARTKKEANADDGEVADLDRRHLEYFATLAQDTVEDDLNRWVSGVSAEERDNIRAALHRALSHADWADSAIRLANPMIHVWTYRGPVKEGQRILRFLLDARSDCRDSMQAEGWNNMGVVVWGAGDHGVARQCWKKSLRIREELGDLRGQARCHSNLGIAYADAGRPDDAQRAHEQAIKLYSELADDRSRAQATLNLVGALVQNQQFQRAIDLIEQILPVFEEQGDRRLHAAALHNLGECLFHLRTDLDRARALVRQSIRIKQEIHHEQAVGLGLRWLGIINAELSDNRAVHMLAAAERIRSESGAGVSASDEPHLRRAMNNLRLSLGPERFEAAWNEPVEIDSLLAP